MTDDSMTDDLMDRRLKDAGVRWREANPGGAAQPTGEHGIDFEILAAPKRRRRWTAAASAAIVAAAVVIGGAFVVANRDGNGHDKPVVAAAASPLDGTWSLTDQDPFTATFSGATVTIKDGCGQTKRKMVVDGDRLTFGAVIGRPAVCSGPRGAWAAEGTFDGTVTWRIADGILALTKAGTTLLFTRSSGARADLVGTNWRLATLTDREGSPVPVAGNASLQIDSEQKLSGNDGCNYLSGTAAVTLRTIDVRDVATTAMACTDDAVNVTAAALDALLSGRVDYTIDGSTLTISKPGAGRATYRAAAAPGNAITDPAQLSAVAWKLTQTQHDTNGGNGGSSSGGSAISLSVLAFDGKGGFTVKHKCYTDKGDADLGPGTATFTHVTLKSAVPCASNAETTDGQNENSLVDGVLDGPVTWKIESDELTITKGANTLTFAKA